MSRQSSGRMFDQANNEKVVQYAFADPAGSGDNQLVAAAGAGVKIRVLSVVMSSAGTVNARFRSATNSISNLFTLAVNNVVSLPYNPQGWFQTNANEALNLNLSTTVAVGVTITYITTP